MGMKMSNYSQAFCSHHCNVVQFTMGKTLLGLGILFITKLTYPKNDTLDDSLYNFS